MAIDVRITKQLNKDFVQVESQQKNQKPRFYQVPVQTADNFCKQLYETEKKSNVRNNIVFAAAALGGCGLGNVLAIKLKPTLRGLIGVLTGIVAGFVTNSICLKKTDIEQNNVLKQNRAIDITQYFRN